MAGKMIARRRIYSNEPPAAHSREDDNPTLLISWWCTAFALTIILVRIFGRKIRTDKLFREDWVMALSILPLLIRMSLVHVILLWGTNNAQTQGLTETEIYHREIGSRLVLASRIFYALLQVFGRSSLQSWTNRKPAYGPLNSQYQSFLSDLPANSGGSPSSGGSSSSACFWLAHSSLSSSRH